MKANYLILFLICIFEVSCSYMLDWKTSDLVSGKDTAPKLNFSEKTVISASFIESDVLQSCKQCHSGQNKPNLASLDDIRQNIDKVMGEISANRMPPSRAGGPLNDCNKAILAAWIKSGTPDTSTITIGDLGEVCGASSKPPSSAPNPPPPPTPAKSILNMPLNFETLDREIIQPRCQHCHNDMSSSDAKDYPLSPYPWLISNSEIIGVNSQDSSLYKEVSATDEHRMPPPSDSGPLAADEIEFIKRWLDAGHPEK